MVDFKRGSKLGQDEVILDVEAEGKDFYILKLDNQNICLFMKKALYDEILSYGISSDFLEKKFNVFSDGYYFVSRPGYKIFSAIAGPYADNVEEIISLCTALKEICSNNKIYSSSDVIYVEEFNILLPVYVQSDDSIKFNKLVGSWLTEGFKVDATSVDRVIEINQWLNKDEIQYAIEEAGLSLEDEDTKEKISNEQQAFGDESIDVHITKDKFKLPGRRELVDYFNDQIVDFMQNIEKYENMGIKTMPATLLYGNPGSGKTYAVEKLAKFLNIPCFEINSSSVASPYVHDTSKKIAEVFNKAIKKAPSILIIDEMESYLSSRTNNSGGTHHIEEVDEFLRNIPKAIESKVIIFGMTNMIDLIDPAILRKGRFDFILEVGMPSKDEIVEVLENELKKYRSGEDIFLGAIADKLIGRPMSDVAYIVRHAARIAVQQGLDKITHNQLIKVVDELQPTNNSTKKRSIGFQI